MSDDALEGAERIGLGERLDVRLRRVAQLVAGVFSRGVVADAEAVHQSES